ncbi:MAG: protein jag [Acholeplasmataceae bacterium]|nr:protein jag [Acholeplasmataceae bacterium]
MGSIEMTGKTVDEALEAALAELHTTRENVDVEILEEAKDGLFGLFGGRKARIKVTLKAVKGEEKEEEKPAEALKETENVVAVGETKQSKNIVNNDEAIKMAKEFLLKIFASMNIKVVMEKFVSKEDGVVTFKLHGADMGILIGKHGQTLDSLQYLTNLVANKNSAERIRIMIDIEDYRERRAHTLTRLALRLAERVKRSGDRVVLEPMNPHERKIIHMALQNDSRVNTLSEGEDPYRRVAIELKK